MHLCLEICACINEPLRGHMNTYACLEAREMRDVNFSKHNIYCDACIFFFFCFLLGFEIYLNFNLGGSTVWHLNPNTLRGDLTWGLPELQIEWFNGLES